MIGLILALCSAIFFGFHTVIQRRSLLTSNTYTGVITSLSIGLLLFIPILLITGDIFTLTSLSIFDFVMIGIAGIFHFVGGRSLLYEGIQKIGSNRTTPILSSSIILTMILSNLVLLEKITTGLLLTVFIIIVGIIFVSSSKNNDSSITSVNFYKGIFYVSCAVFLVAVSNIIVKIWSPSFSSPVLAVFLSYVFALIVYFPSGKLIKNLGGIKIKTPNTYIYLIIAGVTVSLGQLCRYFSLYMLPVTTVIPLIGSFPFFTIIFSYILNRNLENFGIKLILGLILIFVGISTSFIINI